MITHHQYSIHYTTYVGGVRFLIFLQNENT